VTPEQAVELARFAPTAVRRVGLFVEPTEEELEAALAVVPLDILQLYTSAERAAALGARFGKPVWRGVSVAAQADLPVDAEGVDAFLLDAKPSPASTRPGGNAMRFDWSLIAGWSAPAPWVLAGGLDPDNVAEAVAATGAETVDVSSGVESAPGRKDPARIRAFVAAAKR
jgi:phosphoribosylanthranilate isomerase